MINFLTIYFLVSFVVSLRLCDCRWPPSSVVPRLVSYSLLTRSVSSSRVVITSFFLPSPYETSGTSPKE